MATNLRSEWNPSPSNKVGYGAEAMWVSALPFFVFPQPQSFGANAPQEHRHLRGYVRDVGLLNA